MDLEKLSVPGVIYITIVIIIGIALFVGINNETTVQQNEFYGNDQYTPTSIGTEHSLSNQNILENSEMVVVNV